ncbi:hypothetical protein [Vibrio quintilis]|uniref:hypothetical protein n=1 Tax=Vibrio quintilis TaxID=1117707 RepID=UPI00093678DE|nr:hypothetical protein [Vibrio quintilis]
MQFILQVWCFFEHDAILFTEKIFIWFFSAIIGVFSAIQLIIIYIKLVVYFAVFCDAGPINAGQDLARRATFCSPLSKILPVLIRI